MTDDPVPVANSRAQARKQVIFSLAVAGTIVAGALLMTLAKQMGLTDQDTVVRVVMAMIGLSIFASGNLMPKMMDGPPPQTRAAAAVRQAVRRVGGWALMLSGLAYALLWAFAPRDIATIGSIAAVGAAMVVTIGYAVWRFRGMRPAA